MGYLSRKLLGMTPCQDPKPESAQTPHARGHYDCGSFHRYTEGQLVGCRENAYDGIVRSSSRVCYTALEFCCDSASTCKHILFTSEMLCTIRGEEDESTQQSIYEGRVSFVLLNSAIAHA